jgi:hypothetical protein
MTRPGATEVPRPSRKDAPPDAPPDAPLRPRQRSSYAAVSSPSASVGPRRRIPASRSPARSSPAPRRVRPSDNPSPSPCSAGPSTKAPRPASLADRTCQRGPARTPRQRHRTGRRRQRQVLNVATTGAGGRVGGPRSYPGTRLTASTRRSGARLRYPPSRDAPISCQVPAGLGSENSGQNNEEPLRVGGQALMRPRVSKN